MVKDFAFAPTPDIRFGAGKFEKVPEIISQYGTRMILITGGSSLEKTGNLDLLKNILNDKNITFYHETITSEPAPDKIDELSSHYRNEDIEVVAAVGGGSVIDTGKAVSAMLTCKESVMAYLEGVGEGKEHSGDKIPFIAVPTTSGTGSEATKNAVLSRVGKNGFKKSLRHDNFIPDKAVLDPALTISCPPKITAASGMDAISQLLGAYVSTAASPMTDSLVLKALELAGNFYYRVCTDLADDLTARKAMAYTSLISGIALANAGLGIVHGLASPVGGFFDIPHGVVCGTLLPEAVKINIKLLREKKNGDYYLRKYALAGALLENGSRLGNLNIADSEIDNYCERLVSLLEKWVEKLPISRLGEYGIQEDDLAPIVEKTGNKNNPVILDHNQIENILRGRL